MSGYWHEQRVRERAYQIWEREGRPEGKSDECWRRAQAEIAAEESEADLEAKLEQDGAV
jgi:hypothetical protein